MRMTGHCHTGCGARRHPFQPLRRHPGPGSAGAAASICRARSQSLAICSCRAAADANLASARTKPMNSTSISTAVQIAVEVEQEHLQHRLAVVERRAGAEVGGAVEPLAVAIDAHGVDAMRQRRAGRQHQVGRRDSRGRCRAWHHPPPCPPRATSGRACSAAPSHVALRQLGAHRAGGEHLAGLRHLRPPPSPRSHARPRPCRSVSGSPARPLPKRKS